MKRIILTAVIIFTGLMASMAQQAATTTTTTATGNTPEKIGAAFTKSIAAEAKSDFTGAIKIMNEVYEKGSYEINLRMGWLHYLAGLYKESVTYYQHSIDLKPQSIEARLGYVYPAAILGNMDQVKHQYVKILEIDPQNSTAHYRLGYIYYEKKDYVHAHKHFENVVKHYPFGYDGLLMLAWTDLYLGKKAEARTHFTKILWMYPDDKSAKDGLSQLK